MSAEPANSWQTASILAQIESREGTHEERKLRSHQAVFAIANLFFCGYFDQFIRNDTGTHYLTLFIGIEACLSMLFTMAYFIGSVKEILIKTTSFPVSSPARFFFVLISSIRRPLFLALYLTNCLFFAVFFWKTRMVAGWAILLFSLMIIDIQLIISILAVLYNKISFAGIGVTLLFASFILITSSILFHTDLILGGFPMIQWVVNGLTAIQQGEESVAMIYVDVMGGIMILSIIIGVRIVNE